ncbi:hypothetical protein GDO81_001163 [Engystomops pustulosus]|uniref:Uncharacterized protein n=1 Tax=Engystomops pustulosus TaxID=76066 RepID=A0AAV7DCI8_ENGPU|nr:hypothetical protein GDO81_001163 [Engystomops pustulosus]
MDWCQERIIETLQDDEDPNSTEEQIWDQVVQAAETAELGQVKYFPRKCSQQRFKCPTCGKLWDLLGEVINVQTAPIGAPVQLPPSVPILPGSQKMVTLHFPDGRTIHLLVEPNVSETVTYQTHVNPSHSSVGTLYTQGAEGIEECRICPVPYHSP